MSKFESHYAKKQFMLDLDCRWFDPIFICIFVLQHTLVEVVIVVASHVNQTSESITFGQQYRPKSQH